MYGIFSGRRLAARILPPVTIRELRLALQDEWAAMAQQLIDTLILSMGRRCETCLAHSGGYLSGHVNTHISRIWSLDNPHEVLESQPDSPKLNVLCAISWPKVYGSFVLGEPTVTGFAYLDALQLWLFPQLKENKPDNFIWQQGSALSHWHPSVRDWLNITVIDQWIPFS
ncbi:uncharacterized protein TNCV_441101 [Trichonephila clavipes]|nr:uncharacterized protein TNCV_441101 [Trichonephila clavipes]